MPALRVAQVVLLHPALDQQNSAEAMVGVLGRPLLLAVAVVLVVHLAMVVRQAQLEHHLVLAAAVAMVAQPEALVEEPQHRAATVVTMRAEQAVE